MTRRVVSLVVLSAFALLSLYLLDGCGDQIVDPPLLKSPRDYTWSVDTIYANFQTLIVSIWGSSPRDVYAVGPSGYPIWRYDGVKWTGIPAGDLSRFNGVTYDSPSAASVYGLGPNSIWVAGAYTRRLEGRITHHAMILHYDGKTWKSHDIDGPPLKAIFGASSNDIYAVGEKGFVFHYDGKSWNRYQLDSTISLSRVNGKNREVYALGFDYHAAGQKGVFVRLFPDSAVVVDSQNLLSPHFGAWGLYIPQEGLVYTSVPNVYRRFNSDWLEVLAWDNTYSYFAMSGSGPDNIFVNHYHWNGTDWKILEGLRDLLPDRSAGFDFRWAWTDGNEAFICGILPGGIIGDKSLIFHGG